MAKIRDFNTLVGLFDRGALAAETNAKLADLVQILNEQGAVNPKKKIKGSITVTIDLSLQNDIVSLAGVVSVKKPKEDPRSTMLWITKDGSLSNEHPTQIDMFPKRAGVSGEEVEERQRADLG